MEDERAARIRRSGTMGLAVAAIAIAVLGLAGPLMLAMRGDAGGVLPFYPLGWAIAIGGWLWWLRARRAAAGRGDSDSPERGGDRSPPR